MRKIKLYWGCDKKYTIFSQKCTLSRGYYPRIPDIFSCMHIACNTESKLFSWLVKATRQCSHRSSHSRLKTPVGEAQLWQLATTLFSENQNLPILCSIIVIISTMNIILVIDYVKIRYTNAFYHFLVCYKWFPSVFCKIIYTSLLAQIWPSIQE